MTKRRIGEAEEVKSEERRRFLELSTRFGFTAAIAAAGAGVPTSSEAAAQTAKEETEREKAATHKMTVATAYILGASRSYPIMHLDFKENVQNATNGAIYVKLAPAASSAPAAPLRRRSRVARSRRLNIRCRTSRLSRPWSIRSICHISVEPIGNSSIW